MSLSLSLAYFIACLANRKSKTSRIPIDSKYLLESIRRVRLIVSNNFSVKVEVAFFF